MVDLYPEFWTTKASNHTEFTSELTANANVSSDYSYNGYSE